jgi:DNA-directed RNA polymerase subunit N (RpoN/RPB10)
MKKKTPTKTLKAKLWTLTSKLVRLQSDRCYTCGKYIPDYRDRDAGHLWSKGGHSAVRFDLDNIRVQCFSCNRYKSGNVAEYAVRLQKEIGAERFEKLYQSAHVSRPKWQREELENLIAEREKLLEHFNQF